ncbi:ACT domain-containing protein [Aestuariibacter salexigens]|uniref:ACT domain-containing protein n=1 Tax=Aestuariibacter salexigens TaxID=226010 RepID=UPI00047AAFB2|nr:ACT domain-containing protein [Aestuariibacter salexigens]
MSKQTLAVLPQTFCIHSLDVDQPIPAEILQSPLYFVGKTHDELSVVAPQDINVSSANETDHDWRVLEVLGPLQLSMVGIMAEIASVLADANVSIFVVSTFETDFFLVKTQDLANATQALHQNGYDVV